MSTDARIFPAPPEIRPKVYVDPDGAEWRAVGNRLEARVERIDPLTGSEIDVERMFSDAQPEMDQVKWLDWIAEKFPQSVPAIRAAFQNPMTPAEAMLDNLKVQYDT